MFLKSEDINEFLINTKEFYLIKNNLLNKLYFENNISNESINKDNILALSNQILKKSNLLERFKVLMQNAMSNYYSESNINFKETKGLMDKFCSRFKVHMKKNVNKIIEIKNDDNYVSTIKNQLFIYDIETLLSFFNNYKNNKFENLVKIHLIYFKVNTLKNIKLFFEELENETHEHLEQQEENEFVAIEREEEGLELLKSNDKEEFLAYFKGGILPNLRIKLYKNYLEKFILKDYSYDEYLNELNKIINSESKSEFTPFYTELLKDEVKYIMNSCNFFLFEENIKKFIEIFILENEYNFRKLNINEADSDTDLFSFNNGCLPIKYFTKFISMASYIGKKSENMYPYFKLINELIIKKLFDFNSDNEHNLIALSIIFEKLFLKNMNQLYLHLRKLNIYPLDLAAKWMSSLFIDFIEIKEVYLLIDRIIGFESLNILPVLSLSIFKKFSKQLIKCQNKEDVYWIIDYTEIEFLEIINQFLFK